MKGSEAIVLVLSRRTASLELPRKAAENYEAALNKILDPAVEVSVCESCEFNNKLWILNQIAKLLKH